MYKPGKILKTWSVWLVGAMIALTLGAGPAAAKEREPAMISILVSPLGAGPLEGYTILGSQVAREHPWLILRGQETPGYLYNIREMSNNKSRWPNTVFATEDTIIQLAAQGGSPILKDYLPDKIDIKWKLLYGEAYWTQGMYFVTLDPKIKSIADLKGKRVGIGLRTMSDWGMDAHIYLNVGFGITPENTKISNMGPVPATEALLDGRLDAAVMGAGRGSGSTAGEWLLPPPLRHLEASGRDLYYLGMPPEIVKKVNQQFTTTYQSTVIPAGTLPKQKEDIQVGIDRGYIAVHPSFPDDLAYEIVKVVAKFGPRMRGLHGMWKIWSPELMVDGLSEENTHPGALKALKELGYWDLTKQFVPMTYP